MTGRLITFEGIDGSGKSTQIARLQRTLENRGYQVLVVREPGGTPISEQIRELLLHPDSANLHPRTEALLFSAARSQLVHQVILPALAAGSVVICDRYADSSVAYQGYGRELPLEEIITTQKFATSNLHPDLKVLLDLPVEISSERKSQEPADRMESAGRAFMARVREGYLKLARSQPEQWLIVPAQTSEEQIAQEIENYVVKIISA